MEDLLPVLVGWLEEFGLEVHAWERPPDIGHDVDLVLSRGSARQEFAMTLKRHATLSGLGYDVGTERNFLPLLIGAASVSPRSADAFRRAGIRYVDAAGNAWIQFGDVLIDVRGKRSPTDRVLDRPDTERTGGNLFSTGRAQVAFVLLQWPRSWTKPQRDVAESAGVSLGQAHNAFGDVP